MVKDAVQNAKEGSWILGGGWNNDFWGGELPSASWIDEISPHNPVWLIRMDGHMALANSLALRIAGVTSLTEDPVGGTIMRMPSGEPTGLLIDAAMELVTPWVKEISVDERREALFRASKYALTRGVTTVIDLGRYFPGTTDELSWKDFQDVYLWADHSKMMIRTCLFFPITTWSRLSDLKLQKGLVLSEWLYLGGVKAFIDGSLGSNSALFYEEYIDTPKNYGLEVMDPEQLSNFTMAADTSGLQVFPWLLLSIVCSLCCIFLLIGGKANDMILDMYESVAATNGDRDRRFRVVVKQEYLYSCKSNSRSDCKPPIADLADTLMINSIKEWIKTCIEHHNVMLIIGDNGFRKIFKKLKRAGHTTLLKLRKTQNPEEKFEKYAMLMWYWRPFLALSEVTPNKKMRLAQFIQRKKDEAIGIAQVLNDFKNLTLGHKNSVKF